MMMRYQTWFKADDFTTTDMTQMPGVAGAASIEDILSEYADDDDDAVDDIEDDIDTGIDDM